MSQLRDNCLVLSNANTSKALVSFTRGTCGSSRAVRINFSVLNSIRTSFDAISGILFDRIYSV